ncbi:MAG: alanine racemase [Flavobacteriales bacterium]|nr:alanine racemase [Flavobacteriales bacterium]
MNLKYTIKQLAKILNTEFQGDGEFSVKQIIIDSRNFFGDENVLFLAISGDNNDGHKFIKQLYDQGCRNFIIEQKKQAILPQDANIIFVQNSIQSLQQIAQFHRNQFDYPVLAITGSNGKTIVKEWLYQLLKKKFNIIRSPKSYNSQVGVPLSILQMSYNHSLAIIEAGISQPGEMEKLEYIISPTYGVLTHIGSAHSQNFSSQKAIRDEKITLFKNSEWYYDFEDNAQFTNDIISNEDSSVVSLNYGGIDFEFGVPFTDKASIDNVITTVICCLRLGVSIELIQQETPYLQSIALRLETKQGIFNNIVINDAYSNDLSSLEIALNHLSSNKQRLHKVVILSDIEQDYHNLNDLYQLISDLIASKKVDQLIGIGPSLLKHRHLFKEGDFFERTDSFIEYLKDQKIENSIILIKGARKFAFEKIGKYFELRSHETKLTIDLGSLRNNIKKYQSQLNRDVKLLCMVKAFGYGSGSKEIGKILNECKVDYLGVAYADEGEELRDDNIQLPIIVMNSEKGAYDKIIEKRLEPSIYCFRQLDEFIRTLIDLDIKSYPIHIKLDTGMKRLGFLNEDIEELISTLASQPEVRVKSIFSHLAASDDPREDLFTNKQIQIFQYMAHQIESGLGYNCIKHILNTAGIERFGHAQMGMVRLGLGMYGVSSFKNNLEPVGNLTTVISQIKTVKKGESIGYNRTQFALNDMIIGIIPIGYADGFSRILSNGEGTVYINGKMAPVVGRVCMDMTIIDLTNTIAKEGDLVEIFGLNKPIQELAEQMRTIPYEVMTSVSQRVQRIYLD